MRPVVPRLILAVLLSLFAVAAVAGAQGNQGAPTLKIAHDGTRDGTPSEIRSGGYAGDPAGTVDPLAARQPDSYETFAVTVPEDTRHSRLEAGIGWQDDRVDLDLTIYRADAAGRPVAPALARSSAKGSTSERAGYAPSGTPVEPGRYVVVVDNVCSHASDPQPPGAAPCTAPDTIPDEDDFEGTITLGNQAPEVTLSGPASVRAKETATFRASATDADGTIATYLFDLDGDGTYELDSDGMPEASTTFLTRGRRTIAVQVLDNSGAAAFASWDVNVTRPLDTRPPLRTFRLSRTTFGGARQRALVITYRLREKARVEIKLRRGAGMGKLVRVIERGVRNGSRYHRVRVRPSRLRRGRYVVRIFVQGASGKRQVAQLAAQRR
jgi:sirohydrochlorin ferrochelatase